MLYSSYLLNGLWEMDYTEELYLGCKNPFEQFKERSLVLNQNLIRNAVPGYWEDMTKAFLNTSFFGKLKINPEYGLQQYPMAGTAPDMALPNITGTFFYRRSFMCEKTADRMTIHFEGVQNRAAVWLNDIYLGFHEGYSTPFEIGIPENTITDGENTIILSVSNHRLKGYMGEPVSGLTSRAANECTGGITGDVELRVYHSGLCDVALVVSDDCKTVRACLKSIDKIECEWAVYDEKKLLKSGSAQGNFSFPTENLSFWSPENPKLYLLKIVCHGNVLERKFGIRRLVTEGVRLRLNGIPYFLRGVCEHCYFPNTIHPTHDKAYYRNVIRTFKNLGFNFIRFHTYIPVEEYMEAADELGMLLHVECPNNTTYEEWKQIVSFCQHHTSVVIYCCGNELFMDESFIDHLRKCADYVHDNTDALFSPMSALRGLEYAFTEVEKSHEVVSEPFPHNPKRFGQMELFCDIYSSYANGRHSYFSLNADANEYDLWSCVYKKPRVSHEICIDGTYTDLCLKSRYKDTRVGKTDMFSSIESHLKEKGLLMKAPIYFRNSSEWQRRVRKYCFENVRLSNYVAGFDFLGPIDTHWHTFGYDVGMMNEFYELKPGETQRNVLMYNSESILLTDLKRKTNFKSGEPVSCGIYISYYGDKNLKNARLDVRLSLDGKIIERRCEKISSIQNGKVTRISDFFAVLPIVDKPGKMKLSVSLDGERLYIENEWELYVFPEEDDIEADNLVITYGMCDTDLENALRKGEDVLLLGTEPFQALPTTFRIGLAGRTSGNLATVIKEHPLLDKMPHDGFCGWQFAELLEDGNAVTFVSDDVPFHPIIEVASSHKYAIRQSALFEYNVFNGRLLVCSFCFKETDPASNWLKSMLISYMQSESFRPEDSLSLEQLRSLISGKAEKLAANSNFAINGNDKTAARNHKH